MSVTSRLRSAGVGQLRSRVRGSPPRPAEPGPPPTGWTIPLAALRVRLDELAEDTEWSVDPDGIDGRALVLGLSSYIVPLVVDRPLWFAANVRLLPHDWLNGRAWVDVRVTVTGLRGRTRTVWAGQIASAAARGRPEGAEVVCEVPSGTQALTLSVDRPPPTDGRAVGRAAWLAGRLIDPTCAPAPARRQAAPTPLTTPPNGGRPLFSVLTPVHDPPLHMLCEAVDSVREQTFTEWELCLVDDGSRDPAIVAALSAYADSDPRIRLVRRERAGGISDATNAALKLASGEYIALLDHDDTLAPEALQQVAAAIAADPCLDMIYSDEAIVAEGRTVSQSLKPAWSPETMCALMYTCHLGVYRRELALEAGGFDPTFDGCQDYDFVLRLAERTDRVAHIEEQLYHWRAHASSTAGGDQAKPYAYVSQPEVIGAHLARCGVRAEVQFGAMNGMHRVVHEVDPQLDVTIVLAVADARGLAAAAATWVAQPHAAWRVLLAAPAAVHTEVEGVLGAAGVAADRITLLSAQADKNPAGALAAAARHATTEQLLICQHPAVGLTHDWLTRLVGYSGQPGIAAAGPVILTPGGLIRDSGVAVPEGIPLPLLNGLDASAAIAVAQNLSAVSGVFATARTVHDRLGGIDPRYGPLALVDYCLRARKDGLRSVLVPDARLTATGPDHSTNDIAALRRLQDGHLGPDPYYNPRYRADRGDYTPRVRP